MDAAEAYKRALSEMDAWRDQQRQMARESMAMVMGFKAMMDEADKQFPPREACDDESR